MTRIPIIASMAHTSLDVGGLFVPAALLENTLKKHCKQLFIHTGVHAFPYQFFGSASALKVGSKHYVFCCGHQIDQFDPENVSFLHVTSNTTISAGKKIWPTTSNENKDTDWVDVRALVYPVAEYTIPNLTSDFFPLSAKNSWPRNASIGDDHLFLIFGYPTQNQKVDYEIPHIHSSIVSVSAKYDGRSHSPHIHRIRMTRDRRFDADGMSGGPVFYLGSTALGHYFVGFAGMIIRGSETSDMIHFVDVEFISKIFDF